MTELSQMVFDYFKEKNLDINEILTELDNLRIDLVKEYIENEDNDEVYIIKKSGNIEPYSQDKILRSIKNAADTKGQQINTSDLNIILEDVSKSMADMGRKLFRTDEIKEYVKQALTDEGHSQIYDSYVSYIKV